MKTKITPNLIFFFLIIFSIFGKTAEAETIIIGEDFLSNYEIDKNIISNLKVEDNLLSVKDYKVTIFFQEKIDNSRSNFSTLKIKRGWYYGEMAYLNYKGLKFYKRFNNDQGQIYLMIGTNASLMLRLEMKF